MACEQQIFTVTAQQYGALGAQAKAAGVEISGASGSAVYRGCTLAWQYDAASGALSITCTDKPWWVPCGAVTGRVAVWVAAAKGA